MLSSWATKLGSLRERREGEILVLRRVLVTVAAVSVAALMFAAAASSAHYHASLTCDLSSGTTSVTLGGNPSGVQMMWYDVDPTATTTNPFQVDPIDPNIGGKYGHTVTFNNPSGTVYAEALYFYKGVPVGGVGGLCT